MRTLLLRPDGRKSNPLDELLAELQQPETTTNFKGDTAMACPMCGHDASPSPPTESTRPDKGNGRRGRFWKSPTPHPPKNRPDRDAWEALQPQEPNFKLPWTE